MRALLAGQIDHADQLALQALAVGSRAEDVTAGQYYAAQLLAIRREQGRLAELEPVLRQILDEYPGRLAYRAALAQMLLEMGREDEAKNELESLVEEGLASVPQDLEWLTSISLLADVCADLSLEPLAAQLYELLLPFAEVNVVIGLGAVCEGAAARHLGRLAAAMGRLADSSRHFELALERNRALRAPICVARTQLDYASALTGARSRTLVEAASKTAKQLGLVALGGRAKTLR
jgi:tetratricopeptide (TPR) repeat protein